MPKVSVNPQAKAPEFNAVQAGEYRMKFERVEDAIGQSERGNWSVKMRLVHLAPSTEIIGMNGVLLKATELPSSVFQNFMMNPEWQGTLRQAFEATGQAWPTEALEFNSEEEFGNWIIQSLDQREVIARLKTEQYQGNWSNKVARFVVPESAA